MRSAILWYLLASVPICFLGMGAIDVITMEGIVADGARYMDRTGEYSVPRLYGEIYSYKPPLAYWLALASFRLFGGESEWALRFPFALSGLLIGLAVLLVTSRVLSPRTGLLCAFASLTGALTLQKIHLAEFDMPLAAGVGIAAAVACHNLSAERARAGLWLIGYLALALGFLAKGVPALMFYGPGLLLAALATRRYRELFRPAHLAGVLLFTLVVSLWVASAYQAAGWEAFAQPLAEGREKGLAWSLATIGETLLKPLKAWALFLPWSLLLPTSLSVFRGSDPSRRLAATAGAFVVAGVAMFMLVPAAQSRYLLPLAAPVGILSGALVRSRSTFVPVRWPIAVAILFWLAHSQFVEPHRAESRSLKTVAAAFEAHLEPGSALWTGPVSKHYRHSSISYYLNRPIETFSTGGPGPRAGDYLIFFSDEHEELMIALSFEVEIVERRTQRRYEYILARVLEKGAAERKHET